MNCFSELKYSMYVDRELPADEERVLETHLFICPRCRALVDALRVEDRVLADVLQATQEERPESPRIGLSLLWTVLSAVALVLVLDETADWLRELMPGAADWLNPLHPSTLLNLLFSFSMSLANASEGVTMLNTLVTAIGVLILGLSSLVGLYLLVKRRGSLPAALPAGLALIFVLPSAASAMETRRGVSVTVSRNETIDGTLIAHAETLNIDGTVNGDLIVAGRVVTVRGTVKGDIMCFSQTLDVNGNAGGNLYGFVQWLTLRGTVDRNIYGWVQNLEIGSSGRVAGDLIAGAGDGRLSGTVGRDALLLSGNAQMQGNVGRDFRAYVGNITLSSPGRVGGNLTLFAKNKDRIHLDPSVTVAGKTDIQTQEAEPSRYARPRFYFWEAVKLVAALVTGLLIAWLFPVLFRFPLKPASALIKASGVGFLVLVAAPVAAVILAVTLVGLPIAILTLFTWLAGLYLAKVFVGAYLGQELLKSQAAQPRLFAFSLLLGLFVVYVAADLPYIGVVVSSFVILLGLGIATTQVFSYWPRSTRPGGLR